MKKLVLAAFAICIFITGCEERNFLNEESQILYDYKQKLPSDPLFTNYIKSTTLLMYNFGETNVDVSLLSDELKKVTNVSEFESFASKYFNNPNEVVNQFKNYNSFRENLFDKYEKLQGIQEANLEDLIKSSIENLPEMSSVNQIYNSALGTKNGNSRTQFGQCEDQLAADEQTCVEGAVTAAAFCGILSPTLIGALGCGAAVLVADAVCHNAAKRDYGICKKYE